MPYQETMTPRERVMKALAGEPVDRTPVANPTNVATVELMDMVDAPFPQACQDPELAARLAATGYTELGFDSIMPVFSMVDRRRMLHRDAIAASPDWAVIPASSAIEQCAAQQAPVGAFAPRSPGARAFKALWTKIERALAKG